jgi:ABC-type multidrug transport system ATPase subunit
MADISTLAGSTFSISDGRWIQGPGYFWSDLTRPQTGYINGDYYDAWSTLASLMFLLMDIAIFGVLTWYFDHIVPHNRGREESAIFCLKRNYWIRKKRVQQSKKKGFKMATLAGESQSVVGGDDPVAREKERVLNYHSNEYEANGVRIVDLSKTYKMGTCGTRSSHDVHALKNIFLEIEEGELLGLLGHNGAGKTTLINVLTGILSPSSGDVYIGGYSLRDELDDIREIIGVCPQFDILWGELTAREHLWMFAEIKRLPRDEIEGVINKKLTEVNLLRVKDAQVGTFSGGMKRRLSVAISGVGDPKILFLDEPTTGMDPEIRRQVWDLIANLKKDRAVILTTHAMEEADILSDRIAVIVDGEFKCIGTSLYLKNQFGDGYRLTVTTDVELVDINELKDILKEILPSSIIIDESGGNLVFGVPLNKLPELNHFFKVMEGKVSHRHANKLKEMVKNWGVSQSTLEEVFMKVTGKKVRKNSVASKKDQ